MIKLIQAIKLRIDLVTYNFKITFFFNFTLENGLAVEGISSLHYHVFFLNFSIVITNIPLLQPIKRCGSIAGGHFLFICLVILQS